MHKKTINSFETLQKRNENPRNEGWAEIALRKIYTAHPEVRTYHEEHAVKNHRSHLAIQNLQREKEETERRIWGA